MQSNNQLGYLHARISEPYATGLRTLAEARKPTTTANSEVMLAVERYLVQNRIDLRNGKKLPSGKTRKQKGVK